MDILKRHIALAVSGIRISGFAVFIWLLVTGADLGASDGNRVVHVFAEGEETYFILEIEESDKNLIPLSEPYRSQWQTLTGYTLSEVPATEEPEQPKPSKETAEPSTKDIASSGPTPKQPAVRSTEKYNTAVSSTPSSLKPFLNIKSTIDGIQLHWTVQEPGQSWELQYFDLDADATGENVTWETWTGHIHNSGPLNYTVFPISFPSCTFRLVRTGADN